MFNKERKYIASSPLSGRRTWAETIRLMEPFDHGYQRCYIVYRIEP